MLDVQLETSLNTFHLEVGFTADTGKTTVLLGESGSGKTTVLRLLAGLLQARNGHIINDSITYFQSERHIMVPPQERPFGYVFQDYVLFPHLSVYENVAFGLHASRLPRRQVRQRVEEALEQVNMEGYEQRRPTHLSGGQQQRVAIARALALKPQLLLLDEPLSALDVQTRREVRQELRRILAEVELTTILVTHHYLEALLFGEQILVLDDGKVVQQGNQHDLLSYPRSSYVAELVGVNFFKGRIARHETELLYSVELHNGARPYQIVAALKEHGQQVQEEIAPSVGQEAFVIVDPHSITLYRDRPESSARNVFSGRITQLLRLGKTGNREDGRVRVSIMLDEWDQLLNAEITETSAERMGLQEGRPIHASFKATEACVYL